MNKFFATVAAAALLAGATPADAAQGDSLLPKNLSGYVRMYHANSTYNNTSQGWDGYGPWTGWGQDAALNWLFANGIAVQGEWRHWQANSEYDDQYKAYNTLYAAHISKRNDQFLYGAFGGWLTTSTYYSTRADQNLVFGVEGQFYPTNETTAYGQVGIIDNTSAYYKPTPKTVEFADLTGRYFLWDNTKFEAGGSYFHSSRLGDSAGENANLWGYHLELEHRWHDTPVSFFGGYDWWDHHDGIDTEGGDHTIKVGLKVALGTDSLRDEDRKGANLKVIDFAPLAWLKLDGW